MIHSYNELGRYLFVSMDENGLVGSIYYENGRIRLVHSHGPTVELLRRNEYVAYFVVPNNSPLDGYYKHFSLQTIFTVIFNNGGYLLSTTNAYVKDIINRYCLNARMCDINNCIVGYYLYEIYFSEDRQYKGDHPSRGYPKYININDIKGSPYTEIFLIAQICQTHRQIVYSFYNEIVFGLFYGWYCINPQKPFDIHSPDSVKQGNPYYLDEDGKFYRY